MSRIRSVHPGLWTDEAFMCLSMAARMLLIGLWTEAYDDGIFEWKPLTLKARIFPVDNIDINELLEELVKADCICSVPNSAKPAGAIRNFCKFQRPRKPNSSQLLPDEFRTYVGLSDASSVPVRNQFGTGTEKSPQREEGGGKREEINPQPPSQGGKFDIFFSSFPESPHNVRSKAQQEFSKLSGADQSSAVTGAKKYRASVQSVKSSGQSPPKIKRADRWIADRQWEAFATPAPPTTTRIDRYAEEKLFKKCEEISGKSAPSIQNWSFPIETVERARKALA